MKNSKPLLVLCTLAVPVTVMAEDVALGTMVVTARRAEAKIEETPQRIEIIGTEQIESTPSLDLTDTLKKNSSVDVIQYPGNLSGIGIRGFRPEFSGINKHSLLLIDGRPAMGTNLSLINMDRVERIEVLKGPASALYGSQAMGGVVNVITRESKGPLNGFGQMTPSNSRAPLVARSTNSLISTIPGLISTVVTISKPVAACCARAPVTGNSITRCDSA